MKFSISTERLLLREMRLEDVPGLFEMDSDPEVHTYLGNSPIKTLEEAENIIRFVQQQYTDNGIARFAVIEKRSNRFIGWAGLKLVKEPFNNHINFYDLGYRFSKAFWGLGYATEAAKASLNFGFEEMKLETIYGMAHIDNLNSQHVLEKVGLTYQETFDYTDFKKKWYKITRNEWTN